MTPTSPASQARYLETFYRNRRAKGLPCNPIPGFRVTYPYAVPDPGYAAGHHTGEDHSTHGSIGHRVVAVSHGTVTQVSASGGTWGPAYGRIVVVHALIDGTSYHYGYCHLSAPDPDLRPGSRVVPGRLLGWSGNSGNSSAPHLHFEARTYPFRYGDDVDPNRVK